VVPLRTADGFGGLIAFLVIGFILNLISKAQKGQKPAARPRPATGGQGAEEQEEGLSLQKILQEIERVKREAEAGAQRPPRPAAPPTRTRPKVRVEPGPARSRPAPLADRGPLGRHSGVAIPGAEEVEVRDVLGGTSLEVEPTARALGGPRQVVDRDDEAEAVVRQRIASAQARNRPHVDADHQAFDRQRSAAQGQAQAGASRPSRVTGTQLRSAVVWREILGPPRALDEL